MRFILAVLLTSALGFIAGVYLPWWSIAIISFIVSLVLIERPGIGFLTGFTGIFILWAGIALWIDIKNESILSHKIAQLFPLGGSSLLMILITAFIGAMVGGFAAMTGSSVRAIMKHTSGRSKNN